MFRRNNKDSPAEVTPFATDLIVSVADDEPTQALTDDLTPFRCLTGCEQAFKTFDEYIRHPCAQEIRYEGG